MNASGLANPLQAQAAYHQLVGLDDPISRVVREHGPVDFSLPSHGLILEDPLSRLTLSIVGQLISVRAALAIYGRLAELLGGGIDAAGLADADEPTLRAVGLSGAKARAIHELGVEVTSGRFSFDDLELMSDEQVQARLVALRGIGEWSAQMFLLRSMGRPDVFPAGDLGLRRGIESLDAMTSMPSIREAAQRSQVWTPFRSYAAKYVWLHYGAISEI